MSDVRALLERQARWQKKRQALSWPEKIRMAERLRESLLAMRQLRDREAKSPKATSP